MQAERAHLNPRFYVTQQMMYLNKILFAGVYCSATILLPSVSSDHLQIEHIRQPTISKISYTSTGGRAGNYERLEISSSALFYVQGHRGVEKQINKKTDTAFWTRLTRSINLRAFDNIKSNPGHALYDGIDITISIQKGTEKHSIINGNEDSVNYKKIRPFTDLLEGKLIELRKKIIQ